MADEQIHRTTSADGTQIAGRVRGQGPPLVFIHGILCDEDIWSPLVPHLETAFTCYLLNTRGRGLSDDSADLASERRLEDAQAFAESIGEPVGLVGHSLGAQMALHVAARSDKVSAVAAYEPSVLELLGEEGSPDLRAGFMRMAELAGEGRLADAAEAFFAQFTEHDELDSMRKTGLLDQTGRNVPVDLRAAQQTGEPPPPLSEALGKVAVPILLLKGTDSSAWFQNGVRYVAEHAAHSEVRAFEGSGHFGPALAPKPIAAELRQFFAAEPATA